MRSMRPLLVAAAVMLLSLLVPRGASAQWWRDPRLGCGSHDGWARTKRIEDLPGCDGALPKGAPPSEVALHDAKAALHDAERALARKSTSTVAARIAEAAAIMERAPDNSRV